MRNPFKRTEYVRVEVPQPGVLIQGVGTAYPSVRNNTEDRIRISFPLVGAEDQWRSVEIPPKEIAPFHVSDGTFRANIIEVV